MAVNFKIYQSKMNNASKGLYYARATYRDTVDLQGLAEAMQANCTVKKADIQAVLCELVETMKRELLNSNRVKITGLGTFKVGLKTKGSLTAKAFSVKTNVVGARIIFQPEQSKDINGKYTKPLLAGMKVEELNSYSSVKKADVVEHEA